MSNRFTPSWKPSHNLFDSALTSRGNSISSPFTNSSHSLTGQQSSDFDPLSKENVSSYSKIQGKVGDNDNDNDIDNDNDNDDGDGDFLQDLHQRFIASTIFDDDGDDYASVEPLSTGVIGFIPADNDDGSRNSSSNSGTRKTDISIWGNTATAWKTEDYYSNDQEFDPTLQYYHGELYDTATIQDLNRFSLQAQVPSEEELQRDNVDQDMSSLQMLQTIFKDLSEVELIDTLEKYDYDADAAIDELIQKKILVKGEPQELRNNSKEPQAASKFNEAPVPVMANDTIIKVPGESSFTKITIVSPSSAAAQQQQQEAPIVPRKRQVCRHFLAGECYRKDCWFSHDLQDKVCKFWLQGSCLKGDSCEFSHTIDLEEVTNKITTTTTTVTTEKNVSGRPYNAEEYPALSSSRNYLKKDNTKICMIEQGEPKSTVNEDFPSLATAAKILPSSKNVQTNSWSSKATNFAEVAKKKKDDPIKTKQLLIEKNKYRYAPQIRKYTMQELSRPVHIPWLDTGSSMNSVYMKERQKAIEYGMLRNRFFSKATESYLKGDGAKAKLYSMEAKHYNKLMQDVHSEASKRIFESRSTSEAFIDLHGLHEDEALEIVEQRLKGLKGKYSGIIYIVTGTGHHSGTGGLSKKQSKLKPIVYRYLKEHHYHFAETSIVNDNQGGVFAVEIP